MPAFPRYIETNAPSGTEEVTVDGVLHNEHGPAQVVYAGDGIEEQSLWQASFFYKYGVLHRDNGPAVMRTRAEVEYWLNGEQYTALKFSEATGVELAILYDQFEQFHVQDCKERRYRDHYATKLSAAIAAGCEIADERIKAFVVAWEIQKGVRTNEANPKLDAFLRVLRDASVVFYNGDELTTFLPSGSEELTDCGVLLKQVVYAAGKWETTFLYDRDARLHCDDGPAIWRADGTVEYWLNGELRSSNSYAEQTGLDPVALQATRHAFAVNCILSFLERTIATLREM